MEVERNGSLKTSFQKSFLSLETELQVSGRRIVGLSAYCLGRYMGISWLRYAMRQEETVTVSKSTVGGATLKTFSPHNSQKR
jgi:hypothetical protein